MDSSSGLSDDDINSTENRSVRKAGGLNSVGCKAKKHNKSPLINKVDKSFDVFAFHEISSSSEDSETSWPCSNRSMSTQQNRTGSSSQTRDKNRLSLKKKIEKYEGPSDSPVDQSKGFKVKKTLFSSKELSKTFTEGESRMENILSYTSPSEKSSVKRRTSKLSLRKSPQFKDSEIPESQNEISSQVEKLSGEWHISDACSSKSAVGKKANKNKMIIVEEASNLKKRAFKKSTNYTDSVSSNTTQEDELLASDTSTVVISESESYTDTSTDNCCAISPQPCSVSPKNNRVSENQRNKISKTKQTSRQDNDFIENSMLFESDPKRSNIKVKLSQSVEENIKHFSETKTVLDFIGENSHLKQEARKLSGDTTELQATVVGSSFSQEDTGSLKDQSQNICYNLMKSLKSKRLSLAKLINAKVSSLQKKEKELSNDTIVISSDEETGGIKAALNAQSRKKKESDLDNDTLVKRNPSVSWSMSRSSSLKSNNKAKQNPNGKSLKVAVSLNSKDSPSLDVQKIVPSLSGSTDSSSLSQEIPYQGECINRTASQTHGNQDPGVLRLISDSSNASTSLMPSLQRKPSSFYENELFEEHSPPLLSQYFITSTPVQQERSITGGKSSPVNSNLNMKDNSSSISRDRQCNLSAIEDLTLNEVDMFTETENSNPSTEHTGDHGTIRDILDMLDTPGENVEIIPEQNTTSKSLQEHNGTKSNTDHTATTLLQCHKLEPSGAPDLSVSAALPALGGSLSLDNTVVKKEEDTNALSNKANASMYSEVSDEIYVLDSDDDEFFMSQSVQDIHYSSKEEPVQRSVKELSERDFHFRPTHKQLNRSEETYLKGLTSSLRNTLPEQNGTEINTCTDSKTVPSWQNYEQEPSRAPLLSVSAALPTVGGSLSLDHAVVKMEEETNSLTSKANASMYSEASDEIYVLDSDDDEFFMSQSIPDTQYASKEGSEKSLSSENTDSEDSNFQNISNDGNDICVKNEATELDKLTDNNDAEFALSDNDDDTQFLSEMYDDDDDCYIAHTQVDYVNHSDSDEFEDEADFNDNVTDVVKNNDDEGNTPMTLDSSKKAKHHVLELSPENLEEDNTQSPLSPSATGNIQDSFCVVTSITKDKSEYDAETLPNSYSSDDDTQSPSGNDTHKNPESVVKKQGPYEKETLVVSSFSNANMDSLLNMGTKIDQPESKEEDPYGKETVATSPSSSENSESFFTMATQKIFQAETENEDVYERKTHAAPSILNEEVQDSADTQENSLIQDPNERVAQEDFPNADLCNSFSLTAQKSFQPETNEHNTYDRETLAAVSPSSSQDSECFLSMATQKNFQSETNDYKVYERETVSALFNEDTQYLVEQEINDNSPLALRVQNNFGSELHAVPPNKKLDSLYSVATQKDFQPETKELDSYDRETLAASPYSSEDSECFFSMATQKNLNPDKNDQNFCERKTDSISLNEDTQHPFDTETQENDQLASDSDPFEVKTQAVSPNADLDSLFNIATQKDFQPQDQGTYDRETLAVSPSSSQDSESFLTMATQKDFGSERNGLDPYGRETLTGSASLKEDTQYLLGTGAQENDQPESIEQNKFDKIMHADSQTKKINNLYNMATQKTFLSQIDVQHPYSRETLVVSSSPGDDSERLCVKEVENSKETKFQAPEDAISPSITGNHQDPFSTERDVSSLEDQFPRCRKLTVSLSVKKDKENYFDTQTQKDISPSKVRNMYKNERVVDSASSRRNDSSESFFSVETQKDACSLPTDQDHYDVQTVEMCTSFNEEIQDPFSVETQIDSPSRVTDDCLYDAETLAISPSLDVNNQDPYSVETEVDSLLLEHSSRESLTAVSVSKETKTQYLQRDITPVLDMIPCDKKTGTVSLRTDNDSNKGQITPYSETEIHDNCLLPAHKNYSKCTKEQIHESLAKSPSPVRVTQAPSCVKVQEDVQLILEKNPVITETLVDSSLPNVDIYSNLEMQSCLIQKDHENCQSHQSVGSSENQVLKTNQLQNIERNMTSIVRRLIQKLSVKNLHKMKEPRHGLNSITQNSQSPYFTKCKNEALTTKSEHTHITEPLAPSLPSKDTMKNGLSSVVEHVCDLKPFNDRKTLSNSVDKDLCSNEEKILSVPEVLKLNAAMTSSTSSKMHHLEESHTHKHLGGETVILQKNLPVCQVQLKRCYSSSFSSKLPILQNDGDNAKRKCMMKVDSNKRLGSTETADRKRPRESKELTESLPSVKKIKVTIATENPLGSSWITVNKQVSSHSRHNQVSSGTRNGLKLRRPRSKSTDINKALLTSQVEIAKQKLEERKMGIISARSVYNQKTESSPSNVQDIYEDVEMPSTQDMMSLNLPILSAKLPVSKKHLACGLPSQGRITSEERDQAEKFQFSSGKDPNKYIPISGKTNSSTNATLPPVPLFNSLETDKCTSHVADTTFPAHSAVTVENVFPTGPSSREPKGSHLDPSLVMSTCHKTSGTEPNKLITDAQRVDRQSSSPSSSSPPSTSESVQTALPMTTQLLIPANSSGMIQSTPALDHEKIHLSEPNLLILPNYSKKAQDTTPKCKGILKKNSPVLHQNGSRTMTKVKFSGSSDNSHVLVRPLTTVPQTDALQLQESAKSKPESKLYFLSTVLNWNPVWLQEREIIQALPELFGSKKKIKDVCYQLRMYYSTFPEYVDITLNLLVLECWEIIYKDWKTSQSQFLIEVLCLGSKRYPSESKLKDSGSCLICIEVIGLVKHEDKRKVPSVGDLLEIDFLGTQKLQNRYGDQCRRKQFAFVKNVSCKPINNKEQFLQTYKHFESSPALRERNPVIVNICLVLRNKGVIISPTVLHTIKVISSLRIVMRQIDALINLPESTLCTHLLKPGRGVVFSHQNREPDAHLLSKLNREQASAIATILPDVLGSPSLKKVFLLQGPPGTGKSHTILALIHQILAKTNFTARICLATPSNAAVDEIAKRIINFSHQLKRKGLKTISLVRVGNRNKVQSSVQQYMLEDLVTQKLCQGVPESLRAELNSLKKQKLELEKSLSDPSLAQVQKVVKTQRQGEILKQISKLEADIARKNSNPREKYNAKCYVLDEAHVICGTLNSFGSDDLKEIVLRSENHRHKKVPFTCLIIDEATQAIEVDCLIPLQYRMTKVILVGDHEQLPATVLSQMASDKLLTRSLFERMDLCVREFTERNTSSVMILTKQYRMHKEILHLPNSFFYDCRLVTDESVLARPEVIAPYLVFDIEESRESRDENNRSILNEGEAICTAQLCEIVKKKTSQIGVICPYADQQKAILACLRERNLVIEVNTVDSFQGQERDVIIMSCVRAQKNPSSIGFVADRKRMNVALTRARRALYVIGHFDTLRTDELWAELYRNAVERNLLVKVAKVTDFKMCAGRAVIRT